MTKSTNKKITPCINIVSRLMPKNSFTVSAHFVLKRSRATKESLTVVMFRFRDVHDRYVRNFSGKLRSLHTLLCYVYNLRTKDLRTKVKRGIFIKKNRKTTLSAWRLRKLMTKNFFVTKKGYLSLKIVGHIFEKYTFKQPSTDFFWNYSFVSE